MAQNFEPIFDYIGDGVYVKFDGYGIELRTNDHLNPTNKIYLEPEILENLINFNKRVRS